MIFKSQYWIFVEYAGACLPLAPTIVPIEPTIGPIVPSISPAGQVKYLSAGSILLIM